MSPEKSIAYSELFFRKSFKTAEEFDKVYQIAKRLNLLPLERSVFLGFFASYVASKRVSYASYLRSRPEVEALAKVPLLSLVPRGLDNVLKGSDLASKDLRDSAKIWGESLTGVISAGTLQRSANLLSSAYIEHFKDKEAQSQAVEGIMARLVRGMV